MDSDEFEKWYDGYKLGNVTSIFNPNYIIKNI